MFDIKDTFGYAKSGDMKERLAAEYWALKIRYKKLVKWIGNKANANNVDALHYQQAEIMAMYLHALKLRAAAMGVNLAYYAKQMTLNCMYDLAVKNGGHVVVYKDEEEKKESKERKKKPVGVMLADCDYYILTDACGEIVRGLAPTPILYCKEEIEKKKSKYVGEFEAHKVRLVPVNDD